MTEHKFRKLLQEKPYLISDMFLRSKTSAEEFAAASTLTPEQVLCRAKQHLDLPDAVWEHAQNMLSRQQQRNQPFQYLVEWVRTTIKKIRMHWRQSLVYIAIILALAFFTLIPAGRTLAQGAFNYVMNVFQNHVKISEQNHTDNYNIDSSSIDNIEASIVQYGEIEEFISATGYYPIYLSMPGYECSTISRENDPIDGVSLRTVYIASDNESVVLVQSWHTGNTIDMGSNTDYIETSILGGQQFVYSVDAIDGIYDGVCILSDSVLFVSASQNVDYERVLSALQQ